MRGTQLPSLTTVVDEATKWRASLKGKGVEVTQVNVTIGGSRIVVAWDSQDNEWEITTFPGGTANV